MSGLFRTEVLEHRQRAWLGKIQLIRPVTLTVLTVLVATIVVAVGTFIFFAHYTKKARIAGFLAPDLGLIRILPPQSAQLIDKQVREGQVVRKGDLMFVLSVDLTSAQGATQSMIQQEIAVRQHSLTDTLGQQRQLLRQQQQALTASVAAMMRELATFDQTMELLNQRMKLSQQTLTRYRELQVTQFVSEAQVQQKTEDLIDQQGRVRTVERDRMGLQRQIAAARAELAEMPLRGLAQQGETTRSIATVRQELAENEARREIVIRAPEDGTVTAVLADVGQIVQKDIALASLVPKRAQLQAYLFTPSSAIGFLTSEQSVLLRYQAYPYQKFGHYAGTVVSVSKTPLPPTDLASLPLSGVNQGGQEPLYRIIVAIDSQSVQAYGKAQPLQAGMQLEADILLDRRRIVEWLFEPVFSVTGKI